MLLEHGDWHQSKIKIAAADALRQSICQLAEHDFFQDGLNPAKLFGAGSHIHFNLDVASMQVTLSADWAG